MDDKAISKDVLKNQHYVVYEKKINFEIQYYLMDKKENHCVLLVS